MLDFEATILPTGFCAQFIIYIAVAPKSAFCTLNTRVILALKTIRSRGKKGKMDQYFPNRIAPSFCWCVFNNAEYAVLPSATRRVTAGAAGRLCGRRSRQPAGGADAAPAGDLLCGLPACQLNGRAKQRHRQNGCRLQPRYLPGGGCRSHSAGTRPASLELFLDRYMNIYIRYRARK